MSAKLMSEKLIFSKELLIDDMGMLPYILGGGDSPTNWINEINGDVIEFEEDKEYAVHNLYHIHRDWCLKEEI